MGFKVGPTASWRRDLVKHAKGDVLEVAVGAGSNFSFYNVDSIDGVTSVTAADKIISMLEVADVAAATSGLGCIPVELAVMDAQAMDLFPDERFDTVLDTF